MLGAFVMVAHKLERRAFFTLAQKAPDLSKLGERVQIAVNRGAADNAAALCKRLRNFVNSHAFFRVFTQTAEDIRTLARFI